jgi:hypothetical protein
VRGALYPAERPPLADVIPDDDTLAVLSALAVLIDRGQTPTIDALEAEARALWRREVAARRRPSPPEEV